MFTNRIRSGSFAGRVVRASKRRLATLLQSAVCGLAILGAAVPARAQISMNFEQQDLISRRGVTGYSKLLGFDKDQTETAVTLWEGSQSVYRATMKDFQNRMQEMQNKAQEKGDWTAIQKELGEISTQMQEKIQASEKQFFDDLKAVCTDEQASRWESVERYRRREVGMRLPLMSGSAVDLILVADRQKVGDKAEVKELLSEYELAIDRPMMLVAKMQDEQSKRQKELMEKMMANPASGMDEVNKLMGELAAIGKDIRNVNRDFGRKIAAVLPDDARTRFEDEIARKSFPRVYRESQAAKMLVAATGLADLSAEQKETLSQLRKSYASEVKPLNERWSKAIEAQEEKHNGTMGVMIASQMSMAMGGGEGDETIKDAKEARDARKELDERTEKRVNEVLNEAQRAKLPEKKVEPEMPWMDLVPEEGDETPGAE